VDVGLADAAKEPLMMAKKLGGGVPIAGAVPVDEGDDLRGRVQVYPTATASMGFL